MAAIPSQADIGYPTRVHWAGDIGPTRPMSAIKWFIVHDTQGYPVGDESVLTAAGAPVESAHGLILPSGEFVYMVPLTTTAWTPGNDPVAETSINVEISGFASAGYADDQYKSLAGFFRFCVARGMNVPAVYTARSGKPGIIGHQDVPNPDAPGAFGGASGHTDPGPLFDWAKFITDITGTAPAPVVDPRRFDPVTGMELLGGMRALYEWLESRMGADEALLDVGRPLTNEFVRGGITTQAFEREVWEWHPGTRPEKWDILRMRLGDYWIKHEDIQKNYPAAFAPAVAP